MAASLSCLYVDDDPGLRELVRLNLSLEGVTVHLADSGIGVEAKAALLAPDLILLDIMMPGRDGYDVLSGLKATEATRDIPVIMLSARSSDADIWEGWQRGADYYVTKPFDTTKLVRYLRRVHRETAHVRQGARSRSALP
ncbi:MAG TPA: response regulator [Acidimicrobiales bacterium]|nr:response regulator [Acidimicrobiales bacterium]